MEIILGISVLVRFPTEVAEYLGEFSQWQLLLEIKTQPDSWSRNFVVLQYGRTLGRIVTVLLYLMPKNAVPLECIEYTT